MTDQLGCRHKLRCADCLAESMELGLLRNFQREMAKEFPPSKAQAALATAIHQHLNEMGA